MSYKSYIQAISSIGGASAGWYSQDGSEHEVAATAGAAISGFAAYKVAGSIYDYVATRVDTGIKQYTSLVTGGHTQKEFERTKFKTIEKINRQKESLNVLSERINKNQAKLDKLQNVYTQMQQNTGRLHELLLENNIAVGVALDKHAKQELGKIRNLERRLLNFKNSKQTTDKQVLRNGKFAISEQMSDIAYEQGQKALLEKSVELQNYINNLRLSQNQNITDPSVASELSRSHKRMENKIERRKAALARAQEKYNAKLSTINTNLSLLSSTSITSTSDLEALSQSIAGKSYDERGFVSSVSHALSIENPLAFSPIGNPSVKNRPVSKISISSSMDRDSKIATYKDFFLTKLNNPEDIAQMKAEGFATSLADFDVDLSVNGMEIRKDRKIIGLQPVTSWTEQDGSKIMTSSLNGRTYISKGVNFFGALGIGSDEGFGSFTGNLFGEKKEYSIVAGEATDSTSLSMSQRWDPEMRLIVTAALKDSPITESEIEDAITQSKASFIYLANDTRNTSPEDQYTAKAKLVSGTIDMETTVGVKKIDDKTVYGLRKIRTVATENEYRSEMNAITTAISLARGIDAKTGVSKSGSTDIYGTVNSLLYTPTIFGMEERYESIANFRETLPVNFETRDKSFLSVIDGGSDLLESSFQGYRMHLSSDVVDAFSKEYGSHIAISDGAGLFNLNEADKFTTYKHAELEIPIQTTSSGKGILTSLAPLSGNALFDKTQDQLDLFVDSLNDVGYSIKSGELIGLDFNGLPLSVGQEFSHASIKKIEVGKHSVRLHLNAIAQPSEIVKVHSVDNKAVLTGVHGDIYRALTTANLLVDQGLFSINQDGTFKTSLNMSFLNSESPIDTNSIKPSQMLDILISAPFGDSDDARKITTAALTASKASFALGWDEVGLDDLKAVLSASSDEVAAAEYSKFFSRIKNSKLASDEYLASASTRGKIGMANAIREIMIYTPNKASQSTYASLLQNAYEKGNEEQLKKLNELRSDVLAGNLDRVDNYRSYVREAINDAYTFESSNTISYSIYTPQELASITGAGNQGSVSRLDYATLKRSGYSKEMLDALGQQNDAALYELRQIQDEIKAGNFQINANSPVNHRQVMYDVFNTDTQSRLNVLKVMYGENVTPDDGNIIRYSLTKNVKGIESIAIPLENTSYSGINEYSDSKGPKLLDRLRLNVINADLNLRASSGSSSVIASTALDDAVDAYLKERSSILKGDGLLKEAQKRAADGSTIRTARAAHGELLQYAEQRVANGQADNIVGYANSDRLRLEKQGISFQKIDGFETLYKAVNKDGTSYLEHLTREPAQGPGSSIGHEVIIDASIDEQTNSKAYAFFPSKKGTKSFLQRFSFLDFDIDAVRAIPTANWSNTLKAEYAAKTSQVVNALMSSNEIINLMGLKGQKNDLLSVTDFETVDDFNAYKMTSSLKGNIPKIIAPEVTNIVTNMSEAVAQYSPNPTSESSILARVMAHNLTENLLKTKNKSNEETAANPKGFAEEIRDLSEAYKKGLSSYNGKPLDFKTRISSIIDDAIGGKILTDESPLGLDAKTRYIDARNLLVNSYARSLKDRSIESFNDALKQVDDNPANTSKLIDRQYVNSPTGSPDFNVSEASVAESKARSLKINSQRIASGIKESIISNKKLLIGTAGALSALAVASGGQPQISSNTQPKPEKLQLPIQDKKAYTTEYKNRRDEGSGKSIRARLTTNSSSSNPAPLDSAINGSSVGSNIHHTHSSVF